MDCFPFSCDTKNSPPIEALPFVKTSFTSLGFPQGFLFHPLSYHKNCYRYHYLQADHQCLKIANMAEDVINSMVNLKLTSEEEEEIQVSEEGKLEEIDSCVLSLIGKFLTSKPFNRKAAKNTLQKAWDLDKELQISEVGTNLFQFKFQSEYELERILRGGGRGGRGVLIINC